MCELRVSQFSGKHSLEVEADRAHDELIRRQLSIDDVSVVDDISAENETAADGHDEIHCLAERDEDSDEAGHAYIRYENLES